MEIRVYNQKAEEVGKTKLAKEIFGLPWNADLVHQVVVSMDSNKRVVIAHAKGRGEVRGGGKKPWRQKGTGRARHGSTRSPIWVGGGVAHGPLKEKNYAKKINQKMRKKALFVALSQKLRDGEMLVLEDLKIKEPKTKLASGIISTLSKIKGFEKLLGRTKNKAMVLLKGGEENIERAFKNLPGILVEDAKNLNARSALAYKYLVFLKNSLPILPAKKE